MDDDTLVLCYHAVSPTWPSELAVEPAALRRQVVSLLERGYRAVRFSEAVDGGLVGRVLAITFDDAYDSVFEHGFPVLAELGVPATLFAPTDFVGTDTPFALPGGAWLGSEHQDELLTMGWDRVRALRDAGWEIGSHTCSHPWLTRIPPQQMREELVRSAAICAAELGEPCGSIAYPFGDHDDAVVAAAAAAGYRTACTTPHRFERYRTLPLRFGRIDVVRSESELAFRLRTATASRRARDMAATDLARWLDTHRPHRATAVAAVARTRTAGRLAATLRRLCRDWRPALAREAAGRPVRGLRFRSGADLRFGDPGARNLVRFQRVFVDDPYCGQAPVGPGETVLDLGAGEGLFALRAHEAGADRVVCAEPNPILASALAENLARNRLDGVELAAAPDAGAPRLAGLLDAAGLDTVDFCRLATPDAAAVLAAADSDTLARIGRLVLAYDAELSVLRLDQLVAHLESAGLRCELDIDPAAGAGLLGAGR